MRPHPLLLLAPLVACGPGRGASDPLGRAAGAADDRFEDLAPADPHSSFVFPDREEAGPRDDGRAPVARLEVVAPAAQTFVLHGTLPVPPGTWPRGDGRSPLAVATREAGSTLFPAQVTTVTRNSTGEADVVEIAARVRRPARVPTGERLLFDVLAGSFAPGADRPEVPASTAALLDPGAAHALLLRTRDVYGNVYAVDLRGAREAPGFGSREVLQSGAAQRVVRTHSVLVPTGGSGAGAALPHLMGVHAYLTTRAGEGRVGLDLRVHNGTSAGSRPGRPEESPLGIVHWDAIELVLPPGWSARALVRDPFLGTPYREGERSVLPLVRPNEDGSLHMMPPQAQFHRRLTLVPADAGQVGHLALEGLAFCRPDGELWSWWNPRTAHYFPQRSLLADWSSFRLGQLRGERALLTRIHGRRDALQRTLETGTPQAGLQAGSVMGWCHPLGVPVQGMTGGSGITFLAGQHAAASASAAGVEALMLEHRMNAARQAEAQWDLVGAPVGHDAWLDDQGRVPFDFRTNGRMVPPPFRLPMQGGPPASPQVRAVHRAGRRPGYDQGSAHHPEGRLAQRGDDLLSWMPHDGQHYARWTRPPMALAWLANDALARDDLRLAAETFHLMFHGSEHVPAGWSSGVTLRRFEDLAAAHPHHGLPIGRDQAWGIDAMCAAWSLADDDWRARRRPWFSRVARLLVDGAMPSGLVQRLHIPKILTGRHDGAQAFECLFLLHAQRCLIEAVLRGTDEALAAELAGVHQLALDYLFWGPVWARVESRNVTLFGPRWHFAVGPAQDWSAAPYSDESVHGPRHLPHDGLDGGVDVTYVWAPLEYGMLLARGDRGPSLDDRYLRRALACGTAPRGWDALLEGLFASAQRDGTDLSGNWSSLVGRIQTLRR